MANQVYKLTDIYQNACLELFTGRKSLRELVNGRVVFTQPLDTKTLKALEELNSGGKLPALDLVELIKTTRTECYKLRGEAGQ